MAISFVCEIYCKSNDKDLYSAACSYEDFGKSLSSSGGRDEGSSLQESSDFNETDTLNFLLRLALCVASLTATLPRFWGTWRDTPFLEPLRKGKISLLERKMYICVPYSWTQRILKVKSGGHLEL
jgi:hypothetical protein